MLFGYACTTPDHPDLLKQRGALTDAGCERIFEEHQAGLRFRSRLGLARALKACTKGDVLVVWRLDRLGRSPSHAIEIIGNLLTRGVVVRALAEELDTSSPEAALTVRVLAALAKFQQDSMTRGDRLRLSPNAFRAPVRPPPRPTGRPALLTPEQISAGRRLIASGNHTVASAARELGLRYSALWRRLRGTLHEPS
jgi:DNA invertase Pin-like site-specific DNA recombinase